MKIKALIIDVDGALISGKEAILSNSIKEWIIRAKSDFEVHLFEFKIVYNL